MTPAADPRAATDRGIADGGGRAAALAPGRLVRYGALQFALNAVALPLYVFLPAYYAALSAMPLATLGGLLLVSRLADAVGDPLLGRVADRCLGAGRAWRCIAVASAPMLAGFVGLMALPHLVAYADAPIRFDAAVLLALVLTYAGFGLASLTHQAWGSTLGSDTASQARIFAWREGLGLLGVLLASAVVASGGAAGFTAVFAASLGLALWLLRGVPQAPRRAAPASPLRGLRAMVEPLRHRRFRRLLAVFVLNGVAASIPATLVLFYIRDRIAAPQLGGAFLFVYFCAAAVGAPLWARLAHRVGAAAAWLGGMLATAAVFSLAALLGPGDAWLYAGVCAGSGLLLGADLVLPQTLVSGLIRDLGHADRLEGAYFGLWTFAAKLTLALAAGTALPLLQRLGYHPGTVVAAPFAPLVLAYAVLPSALKLAAALALWAGWIRPGRPPRPTSRPHRRSMP